MPPPTWLALLIQAPVSTSISSPARELRAPLVQLHDRALRFVEVDRLVRQLAERSEFEDERADLRRIGARAGGLAGAQVDVHVRHAGRRIERGQKARAEVVGEMEEARIARYLIAGEKPAKETDGHLKDLHIDVFVERELIDDQRLRLGGFGVESHEHEGVERIDGRHEQRLTVPIARLFRQRTKLVVTPRVGFVRLPRMKKLRAHLRGHGGAIDRRGSERRLRQQ